eukprot:COSAG01_NODE_46437_length_400_cov_0.860465_1_plen_75_part_10
MLGAGSMECIKFFQRCSHVPRLCHSENRAAVLTLASTPVMCHHDSSRRWYHVAPHDYTAFERFDPCSSSSPPAAR